MSAANCSIGVDVGGTNIKFGIVGEDGTILVKSKRRTEVSGGPDAVIEEIAGGIESLLAESELRRTEIRSIGVGIPGTTDSRTGVVVFAPNLFWKNVAIVRILRRLYDVPICIAQDTRAAAWAEYLVGAGRGLDCVVSVTLGTGIGCGMVVAGRIYHGALNTAGEFGHQIVELDGNPCNCGGRGCLEAHAGGLAIVRRAKAAIPDLGALVHKASEEVEVDDVFRLALNGQPEARRVAGDVVKYVGMGLVNLININSPQLISISGGISNAPPELLLDPLVDFVRSRAYQSAAAEVRICRSEVGEDTPLVGAALLYRENAA